MTVIQHPLLIDLSHELTQGFAARFIRYKASRLVGRAGIRPCDQEDLEQELRLHLVQRFPKFDPKVAHWNAFVTTVIGRHVLTLLVQRRRMKRRYDLSVASLDEMTDNAVGTDGDSNFAGAEHYAVRHTTSDETAHRDLTIDVRDALARLPRHSRELCRRLMVDSPAEVARQMHVPRTTLCGRILSLRKEFTTDE